MNSLSLQIPLVTAEATNVQLSPFGADLVCNYQAICSLLRVLDLPVGSMILYPTLVLQLELGFCSSQSPFVMIRLSNGLMVTPKERPGKGLGVCDRLLPDQGPDQA